jgi:hypothetical protein
MLFNLLKPSGNYICYGAFCIDGSYTLLTSTANISLNSINHLIFVMVKCGVLFEVRTEFLNNI